MDGSTPVRLPETAVLRPTSGKVLTVVIGLFAAVGLFSFVYRGEWRDALGFTPLAVVVVYLCWLLFWYPSVTVEPSGVQVRNPLRTFRVSWPAIVRVDTRYALTLFTRTTKKIVAWSAPSPSRYAGINTVRPDLSGIGAPDAPRGLLPELTARPHHVPQRLCQLATRRMRPGKVGREPAPFAACL